MTVLEMLPTDTELCVHVEQKQDLAGGIAAAVFDGPGREYRYLLTRIWDPAERPLVFLMLNPSTADALEDDPTLRRCTGFAKREGAGGVVVVNLFALRSTDPRALTRHPEPVGRYNDVFIRQAVSQGSKVVAAWGAAPVAGDRGRNVAVALAARRVPLHCLGTTAVGQPRHPLYLPSEAVLEPYGVTV
jgi:hypothetical protein